MCCPHVTPATYCTHVATYCPHVTPAAAVETAFGETVFGETVFGETEVAPYWPHAARKHDAEESMVAAGCPDADHGDVKTPVALVCLETVLEDPETAGAAACPTAAHNQETALGKPLLRACRDLLAGLDHRQDC